MNLVVVEAADAGGLDPSRLRFQIEHLANHAGSQNKREYIPGPAAERVSSKATSIPAEKTPSAAIS